MSNKKDNAEKELFKTEKQIEGSILSLSERLECKLVNDLKPLVDNAIQCGFNPVMDIIKIYNSVCDLKFELGYRMCEMDVLKSYKRDGGINEKSK